MHGPNDNPYLGQVHRIAKKAFDTCLSLPTKRSLLMPEQGRNLGSCQLPAKWEYPHAAGGTDRRYIPIITKLSPGDRLTLVHDGKAGSHRSFGSNDVAHDVQEVALTSRRRGTHATQLQGFHIGLAVPRKCLENSGYMWQQEWACWNMDLTSMIGWLVKGKYLTRSSSSWHFKVGRNFFK